MNRPKNKVLNGLATADLEALRPSLEACTLEVGQVLDPANGPIEHIYFPESGIASVIALDRECRRIEVGPFGREGMSGMFVVMGVASCPLETAVQGAGVAHRIKVEALRQAIDRSPSLHQRLLRYVQAFHIQSAQTLLVNSYAHIEQRLARWVLMAHDRIDGDNLPLTHDFMALMLGVRRAGVTEATQKLEGRKLIKATRGLIVIQDRRGLEELAGNSYGVSEAEYARLMTA
jgi:CRP-like cAMP-binding protein